MKKKRMGIMCLALVLSGSNFYSSSGQFYQVYANEVNTQTQITQMGAMDFLKLCDPSTLIDVTVTEEQAAEMMKVINEVTKGVTKEYDKAKAIYTWVSENIVYTADQSISIASEPYQVFKQKRAVCGGFSNLIKEMLNLAGIPAVALIGYYGGNLSIGVAHQWNAVYVDGEWVYADGTAKGFFDHDSIPTTHQVKQIMDATITAGDLELGFFSGLAVIGCSSTSVHIPDKYEGYPITSISYSLFSERYNVQELYINENITSVEESTLSSSPKIKSITVAEGNTTYSSHEDALFTADLSCLLVYPCAKEDTDFTLPKETSIFDIKEAFNNPKLQNIHVEEGNTTFASYEGAVYNADKTQLQLVPPGKTTLIVYGDAAISDIAFANVDTSKLTIIAKAGSPAAAYAKMYHINLREEPEISPQGGEYENTQQITITAHSDKAKIYYTIDGKDPTRESTLYTGPFTIDSDTTIKAIAIEDGQADSAIVTQKYTIKKPTEVTEAPSISPAGGEYKEAQQITITGKSKQAKIYYTTDGTDPTDKSTPYTAPFTIDSNTTIKAIAIEEGKEKSAVVSQEYKITISDSVEKQQVTAPVIRPESGAFTSAQEITIVSATKDAVIYYTTDGSQPTTQSTKYTAPVKLAKSATIRAIAVKNGWEDSEITTVAYTIEKPWVFTDVTPNGGWKHLAVKYVYNNDIMGTVGASQEFQPDHSLTRAMFATVLYRMAGSPEVAYTSVFEDVPQGKWFSDAVIWAYRNKIVSGVGDGSSYGIDLKITREQIAKMLCEYANTCKYDTTSVKSLDDFTDVDSVSSWAVKYMQWAVAVEMVTGKPNDDQKTWRMDPKGNATRAECAAMLQRFANRYMQ